jgi:hypothetical protein
MEKRIVRAGRGWQMHSSSARPLSSQVRQDIYIVGANLGTIFEPNTLSLKADLLSGAHNSSGPVLISETPNVNFGIPCDERPVVFGFHGITTKLYRGNR